MRSTIVMLILLLILVLSNTACTPEMVHCKLNGVQCYDITVHSESGQVLGHIMGEK